LHTRRWCSVTTGQGLPPGRMFSSTAMLVTCIASSIRITTTSASLASRSYSTFS
jgi:hypothetical protein